jgi:hypothetical protein
MQVTEKNLVFGVDIAKRIIMLELLIEEG